MTGCGEGVSAPLTRKGGDLIPYPLKPLLSKNVSIPGVHKGNFLALSPNALIYDATTYFPPWSCLPLHTQRKPPISPLSIQTRRLNTYRPYNKLTRQHAQPNYPPPPPILPPPPHSHNRPHATNLPSPPPLPAQPPHQPEQHRLLPHLASLPLRLRLPLQGCPLPPPHVPSPLRRNLDGRPNVQLHRLGRGRTRRRFLSSRAVD